MHTVLLIVGGQIAHHHYPQATRVLADALAKDGLGVRTLAASPAATDLAGVDAVVVFTDGDFFTTDAITRLRDYVRRGHGLVTLHTAAGTNKDSAEFSTLVGSRIDGGVIENHAVRVTDATHAVTSGITDFVIDDEVHDLTPLVAYTTLAEADYKGSPRPVVYAKAEGDGRTAHLAHGHSPNGLGHPAFQKLFVNAVRWAIG